MSRIRHFVDEGCLLKMFHSFVQSHVNYNLINWSCTHKYNLNPIRNKIKKAIRILSFSKTMYDHTESLFQNHKILPFDQLVVFRKATLMWKVARGHAPKVISQLFTRNQHTSHRFVIPHVRNDKSKLYFETSCIMAWNSVPDSLKSTFTYNNFTQKFKKHLFDPISDTTTNPTAAPITNTQNSTNNNIMQQQQ